MLELQLDYIISRAPLDEDYVPSLFPGCRQGLIPTAYGAREEWIEGHYWVEPILERADEFDGVPEADFRREGIAAEMLEDTRFFREATGGKIPIQMPDMQGPLDLASNLLGTERLLMDMMERPAAVHRLLERMTRDFIRYMRLQQEAAGGVVVPIHCPPFVWLPPKNTISLSEDLLAVISPSLYPDFGVPYNERIAAAFGGKIVIHTCGGAEHNLDLLATTKGLLAFDFGISETSLDAVSERFGASIVILPHPSPVSVHGLPILDSRQIVDFIFDYIRERDLRIVVQLIALPGMSMADCAEFSREARARSVWPS